VSFQILLTDRERAALTAAAQKGRREEVPEPELSRILEWGERVRFDAKILDMALSGKLGLAWHERGGLRLRRLGLRDKAE
jgi:hypothetical protein